MIYDYIFKNNRNKNTQFGDGKLMDWWRKRHYFSRNTKNDYCIDGKQFLKQEHLFQHVLYCSPTGGGKSTTIINHLLNTKKSDDYSMVILDVSGELENICGKRLRESGFEVSRLDFSQPSNGEKYNPFEYIGLSENGEQELSELLMCPETPPKTFWDKSSIAEATTSIKALCAKTQKDSSKKTLLGLLNLINLIAVKPKEAIAFMQEHLPEELFMDFASFMGLEPKLKSNIIASIKAPLGKLKSKSIQELTAKDTVDLLSLRTKKRVLFLRLEEGKEKYYRFLLSAFNSQLMDVALKMPKKGQKYNPIMMFLDEFPTYRISQFPQMVSVLRKRKVALFIYIQEISQIEQIYGVNGTKTILGNMLNQVYFGNLRREECDRIERLLGSKTEEVNGVLRAMPVLRADQIMGLKKFHCLYVNGMDFTILKIRPWFKSVRMKKRADVQPKRKTLWS